MPDPAATAPVVEPTPTTPPPAAPPAADPVVPTPEQAAAIADEGLDDHAKSVIAAIRNDFKEERSKRQAAEQRATDAAAESDTAKALVAKALGLISDDPLDPAKLAEQIEASNAKARAAEVKLAVFEAADAAGGDPAQLLDSQSFLAKATALDPTDTTALAAAITEAVAANPRLGKATPGPAGMKPNPAQGSSSSPPLGIEAQIAAAEASGDTKAAIRLKAAAAIRQPQGIN